MPSAPSEPLRAFRIGDWILDPALHTLRHPERGTRTLRRKLVQIVLALAERPGAVLSDLQDDAVQFRAGGDHSGADIELSGTRLEKRFEKIDHDHGLGISGWLLDRRRMVLGLEPTGELNPLDDPNARMLRTLEGYEARWAGPLGVPDLPAPGTRGSGFEAKTADPELIEKLRALGYVN